MSTEAGRLAAYADLVAALLDLRDPGPSAAFDAALDQAVAEGALASAQARHLRWLQRETVRRLVEHAQSVLPATLVALEGERAAVDEPLPTSSALPDLPGLDLPGLDLPTEPPVPSPPPAGPPGPDSEPEPPADLQARRLLVAGLRPLPDGPRRGTLP